MDGFVNIRSLSSNALKAFPNGQEFNFAPYEAHYVSEDTAAALKAELGPLLEEVEDGINFDTSTKETKKTVWLANFTGDPLAPELVQGKEWDPVIKRHLPAKVPNPKKHARPIIRKEHPNEIFFTDQMGETNSEMVPGKTFKLMPYDRKEFDKAAARFMLEIDRNSGGYYAGAVDRAKPPADFEPNKDWELDDIRCWVYMCSKERAEMLENLSEAKLTRKYKDDPTTLRQEIVKAKYEALKHVFFLSAKEGQPTPTKDSYDAFREGFEATKKPAKKAPKGPITLADE